MPASATATDAIATKFLPGSVLGIVYLRMGRDAPSGAIGASEPDNPFGTIRTTAPVRDRISHIVLA